MSTKNSKTASKKNASTKNVSEEVETTPESGQSAKSETQTDVGVNLNSAFNNLSIEEMQQQLEARKTAEIQQLEAREAELKTELASAAQRIAQLRGVASTRRPVRRTGGPRGPRAKNDQTLVQHVHAIMHNAGEPMSAREVEAELKKTDYKSTSQNMYVQIFTAITKNSKMFRKVARGKYEALDIDPTDDSAPETDVAAEQG